MRRRRAAIERERARRRDLILTGAVLLAAAAFAVGILIGGGDESVTTDAGPAAPFAVKPLPDLSDAELSGQRLIAGFDGTSPPKGLKHLVKSGRIAGVILFADNVGGKSELRRAIAELQSIPRPEDLGGPLAIMVDQEGGQVKRIDGPPVASGEEMGERGTAYAAGQGRATARSLGRLGINVDLAPVLDIARSGSAIAKEGRSFGAQPGKVIRTAVDGFAAGLRDGGVAATAKHFPGFGAAEVNTDFAAQEIDLSRSELRRVDEAPFAAFADAGGELIMLSVAGYSAFGGDPAALSRAVATRELRGRLGFAGVSISDSLDAEAVQSLGGRSEVALRAADAGTDLLLYGDWETARNVGRALTKGLARGRLDREEFEVSVRRVLGLRSELAG